MMNSGSSSISVSGEQEHYSYNGWGNNLQHPSRGTHGSPRLRAHPPLNSYSYPSDTNASSPLWHHPRIDLPSPRRIVVELFQKVQPRSLKSLDRISNQLLISFGRFVSRDITRTDNLDISRPMPIECDLVETRGPFCPRGATTMPFYRSLRSLDLEDGGEVSDTGEPINFATSYLDLDHIYGNIPPSSLDYLKFRTGEGGKMKLDASTNLPLIDEETDGYYLMSDWSMRILPSEVALVPTYLAYHNKRAEYHQTTNPEWDDETLYWKARMDVIASYQATFDEVYATTVLGEPLDEFGGYDSEVDVTVDVFVSTCSFRYGHSGVSGLARLIDKDGIPDPRDPLLLRDIFKKTEEIVPLIGSGGKDAMASVLRGMAVEASKAFDAFFVDDMSLFMAGCVPSNIQRARDNGLPSYTQAMEWFGLRKVESYLELANGDERVAKILEELYGKGNVDDVDAFVGAMLEEPISKHHKYGPLIMASLREQFERLRTGDRLYYRSRLSSQEIQELPTLSELIKDAWGEEEMKHFPLDTFSVVEAYGLAEEGRGSKNGRAGEMELLGGEFSVRWDRNDDHIDITISVLEQISGGYVGLGWGSETMKGAEIMFCRSDANFKSSEEPCNADAAINNKRQPASGPISCCVAQGERHIQPKCDSNTYLTVLDSCVSSESSYVSMRAQLCTSNKDTSCFSFGSNDSDMSFIASYNPTNSNSAHGFSRRTNGMVNLASGNVESCSDDSSQAGLFALHGATLLFAWLVLVPVAIYVVRYYKEKRWRLRVHIALVSTAGGLMLALVVAALVSVEGTSFGTVDASSASFSKHKIFGLSITSFVLFMMTTGELRRRRLNNRLKSVAAEHAIIMSHRIGGLLMICLAWYNCYTGLIQIGPYESDSVEVTLFSTTTVSMGYDMEFFGFFQRYLFFPWICIVIVTFGFTEFRYRRAEAEHKRVVDATNSESGRILNVREDLPEISIDTFLFLTKHGSSLAIIESHVIDIGTFREHHPGGANVLRFAVGCDITSYFLGELDIGGLKNNHSFTAVKALQNLVKYRIEDGTTKSPGQKSIGETASRISALSNISRNLRPNVKRQNSSSIGQVFRNATVVKNETISGQKGNDKKSIIHLSVSLPRDGSLDLFIGKTLPPTSTFIFRNIGLDGVTLERPYSAFQCHHWRPDADATRNALLPLTWTRRNKKDLDRIVYDFFITVVPGGRMSTLLSKKRPGSHLMVKGPLVSKTFLQKLRNLEAELKAEKCLFIAQGTGITSALHLIDYYLDQNMDNITLLWLVRGRHACFESILKLKERALANNMFRYVLINDDLQNSPADRLGIDSCDHSPQDAFLKRCRAKDLLDQETLLALFQWMALPRRNECSEEKMMAEDQLPDNEIAKSYENLAVAICGHCSFECDLINALQESGVHERQILRFPEGSLPLSMVAPTTQSTATTIANKPLSSGAITPLENSTLQNQSDLELNKFIEEIGWKEK